MLETKYNFSECRDAVNICAGCPCTISLNKPIHVGTAIDGYLTPKYSFFAPAKLAKNNRFTIPGRFLIFGQDLLHGIGKKMPYGSSRGDDPETLKRVMRGLHNEVADLDSDGKSTNLMEAFFSKRTKPELWEDKRYDNALRIHGNITSFMEKAMSRPGGKQRDGGKAGIHHALVEAEMDISKIKPVTNFGAPALNLGDRPLLKKGTGDWRNGLAFMVNGIQYVYIYATYYCYSKVDHTYVISLEYHFYDVFGLDDDDLKEHGTYKYSGLFAAPEGVNAWWQLQHQYNYAPLVTRGVTKKLFKVKL